jgi:hypothetical protein
MFPLYQKVNVFKEVYSFVFKLSFFLSDVFVSKETSEVILTGNQTKPDSVFLSGNFYQ